MKYIRVYEEFVPELNKDQWVDSPSMNKETPKEFRITPDNIEEVGPNPNETKQEVFVFGSNLQGIHTKGAARFAIDKGLADQNQIQGISRNGKAYAIPTQSNRQPLPITEVEKFVDEFLQYAKKNPSQKFLVTKLGTGIAGFKVEEIAPLFSESENIGNIYLPKEFWNVIL